MSRYGRLVYSIPRRLGLPHQDADDIFQAVFGIVLRRLDTLRGSDRLAGWLARITYRESWRLIHRRRAPSVAFPELVDDEASAETVVAREEQRQHLHMALRQLDARDRRLLELLFFRAGETSYSEIASQLQIPVGSIGPTRARALRKLEALLADHEAANRVHPRCA